MSRRWSRYHVDVRCALKSFPRAAKFANEEHFRILACHKVQRGHQASAYLSPTVVSPEEESPDQNASPRCASTRSSFAPGPSVRSSSCRAPASPITDALTPRLSAVVVTCGALDLRLSQMSHLRSPNSLLPSRPCDLCPDYADVPSRYI